MTDRKTLPRETDEEFFAREQNENAAIAAKLADPLAVLRMDIDMLRQQVERHTRELQELRKHMGR